MKKPKVLAFDVKMFDKLDKAMSKYRGLKYEKFRFVNGDVSAVGLYDKKDKPCGPQCTCYPIQMVKLGFDNVFINTKVATDIRRIVLEGIESELTIVINELSQMGMTGLDYEALDPDLDDDVYDSEPTLTVN